MCELILQKQPDHIEALFYKKIGMIKTTRRAIKGNLYLLKSLKKSVQAKETPHALFHLGYMHHLSGDKKKAGQAFEKARTLEPGILKIREALLGKVPVSSPAYQFLGNELAVAGNYYKKHKQAFTIQQKKTPKLEILDLYLAPKQVIR